MKGVRVLANRDIPTLGRELPPGNSYSERDAAAAKEEVTDTRPVIKAKQVAQGKVRKQGVLQKFGRYILEDTIASAKEHTLKEILLPGIRNLIFDTFNEMVATMLFGDDAPRPVSTYRTGNGGRRGGPTSYYKYYDDKQRRESGRHGSYRDMPYDPDDITLDTRAQANAALDELDFIIHKYGQASIATYYDIVGVTGEWQDNRYGWRSIRGASIKPVRDGFMILLPPTIVLDD